MSLSTDVSLDDPTGRSRGGGGKGEGDRTQDPGAGAGAGMRERFLISGCWFVVEPDFEPGTRNEEPGTGMGSLP